jgi:hypothetical protein
MSLFSKILDKLGLRKDKEQPAAATTAEPPKAAGTTSAKPVTPAKPVVNPTAKPVAKPAPQPGMAGPSGPAAPAAPRAISEVDVVKQLEQKAKGSGLNWKVSIVDLLTLLDIDNSREARTELAKELDAPEEVMGDSARMNTWLHKTVLRKIAENGGNIPQNLLD